MLNHTNAQVELFRNAAVVGAAIQDSVFLKRARLPDGTAGVAIANGADGETVVGIAHIRAVAQRFSTVIDEEHVVSSNLTITLAKMPVIESVNMFNVTADTPIDPAKVTWNGSTATFASDAGVSPQDVVTVTYRYAMSMLELQAQGLPIDFANQITGNDGNVEFATGRISVELDNFDTHAEYTIDADVYVGVDGCPTTIPNGAPVAKVVFEPTAANPVLAFAGFFVY